MSKPKKKTKTFVQKTNPTEMNDSLTSMSMDYDKLAEAIIKAHNTIAYNKTRDDEAARKNEHDSWKKTICFKEFSNEKNCLLKLAKTLFNRIHVVFKLLFLKKKEAHMDVATVSLVQMLLSLIFAVIKFVLYIVSFCLLASAFFDFSSKSFAYNFVMFPYSILSFIIARLFRIAGFEVEKIRDRQYLLAILSAMTSFVAMILAVIAIFVR